MKKMENPTGILYKIIDAISSFSIEDLLKKVDLIVQEATGADSTGIYILDELSSSVVLRASKLHFDIIGKLKMNLGEGITGWVAKYGESVVIEKNAKNDKRFLRTPNLPDDLYESFLSVPIKSGDIIIGVINVKHKSIHQYTKEQVELLEKVGKLIGRAVEYADLLEKTKSLEEAVATQKAVERAKGIIMVKMNLTENDAYHLIRKEATKERKSMKEIAQAIITSSKLENSFKS